MAVSMNKISANFLDCQSEILTLKSVLNHYINWLKFKLHINIVFALVDLSVYNKTTLKCALCFPCLKVVARLMISFHFFGSKSLLIPDLGRFIPTAFKVYHME